MDIHCNSNNNLWHDWNAHFQDYMAGKSGYDDKVENYVKPNQTNKQYSLL